jgi:hypothetical protein
LEGSGSGFIELLYQIGNKTTWRHILEDRYLETSDLKAALRSPKTWKDNIQVWKGKVLGLRS